MPSPTSSTCPTSRDSTLRSKSVICLVRTLRISLVLIARDIAAALVEQECAEGLESGADGRIDHPVADLDDHAAEQVRVDADVEDRFLLEHVGEGGGQGLPLVPGQFYGGGDL